jgi:hypothetical protein
LCDLEDSSTIFYLILGFEILCDKGQVIEQRCGTRRLLGTVASKILKIRGAGGIVGSGRGKCFHLTNYKFMMEPRFDKIVKDDLPCL